MNYHVSGNTHSDVKNKLTTFKVMSFNMKKDLLKNGNNSWSNRVSLIVQMIMENTPDIIGTQELTVTGISDLQRLLPQYGHVGLGRSGGKKGEYSAIFFRKERFGLDYDQTFWLSNTPQNPSRWWLSCFPRICTCCHLRTKDSRHQLIKVYNTHLDHISYFARVKGLQTIANHILEDHLANGYAPVILLGDFNATPNSKTMRIWQEEGVGNSHQLPLQNAYHYLVTTKQENISRSYHGFKGKTLGNPIDYIFTSRDWIVNEFQIRRDKYLEGFPSDHYPIIAELILKSV